MYALSIIFFYHELNLVEILRFVTKVDCIVFTFVTIELQLCSFQIQSNCLIIYLISPCVSMSIWRFLSNISNCCCLLSNSVWQTLWHKCCFHYTGWRLILVLDGQVNRQYCYIHIREELHALELIPLIFNLTTT